MVNKVIMKQDDMTANALAKMASLKRITYIFTIKNAKKMVSEITNPTVFVSLFIDYYIPFLTYY